MPLSRFLTFTMESKSLLLGTGALLTLFGALLARSGAAGVPGKPPLSVSLPFAMDHNRMFIELEFLRPDGSVRKAKAWVDTGNQFLMLGEKLASDLGVELSAPTPEGTIAFKKAPGVRIAGLPLEVEGVTGGVRTMPGLPAEANLPASLLRRLHVVFDYPARRLTVARPGVLKPRGIQVPCRVNPETGLFQIEAMIDGEAVHLAVDNGSSSSLVSDALTKTWAALHPERPRAVGAAGTTNFFGFAFEMGGELTRIPELAVGPLRVRDVALLGLPQGLFEWYSKKTAGPVAGLIGANVIKGFRLEIDFPGQMTWWEAGPAADAHDLDLVGLTLKPELDGSFTIAGVVAQNGRPVVEGVRPGDKLIRIDNLDTANATMGTVVDALRGKPGETRRLQIGRQGKTFTIEAKVLRLS